MVSNISIWFVPTGMNRLPQNVLLNFWLEFPKSDLTIYYLPSGISEIFCQMVSTLCLCGTFLACQRCKLEVKVDSKVQGLLFD